MSDILSSSVETLCACGEGLTDVGLQRDHNEDTFVVLPEHNLFIVADGMGGHKAGDVASRMASELISGFFSRSGEEETTWPFHFDSSLTEAENRLLTAIRLANRQIFDHSQQSSEFRGMGTTLVAALFSSSARKMYIGHVGDSRAYRVRNGQIKQLSTDHSLINDYLKVMPDMPESERRDIPKNVITRALGMSESVEVDLLAHDVHPADVFVLCSDGLSGMITDEEIAKLAAEYREPKRACLELTALANEHGGEDNITAVVIRIDAVVGIADNTDAANRRSTLDALAATAPQNIVRSS